MKLKVKRLDKEAPLPRYAHEGDAGLDLTSMEAVALPPLGSAMVGTGIAVEIPKWYVGLVFPRSGLAGKRGVTLRNCVGVIDSGYRGEISVPLVNLSDSYQLVEKGERVCQLVIMPYEACECVEVDDLAESERGEGGFGSSGR